MDVYIFLIIVSLILLTLRNSIIYKNFMLRNMIVVIIIFLLFFLTVFRGITVGTDYLAYNSYYYLDSEALRIQYIEEGYILLNTLARSLNFFLLIPAFEFIISFFGMYSLAKVNKCNIFSFISLYILTYTYMQSFNALRQFIAIGFVSFGCAFLFTNKKARYLWFIFFILLAYEFHSSALIMVVAPILMKIDVTEKKVLFAGIITTFLFSTGLGQKIAQPLIMMNGHYATKYSDSLTFLTSTGNKGIIQFAPIIVQFMFLFLFVRKFKNGFSLSDLEKRKYNFILSGYLTFLTLYSASGNGVIDRIQMFFFVYCVLANAYILDKEKSNFDKEKLLFDTSLILFWVVYCVLRLLINNANVVPYILR